MRKKIGARKGLSFLICLSMILGMLPLSIFTASAEETGAELKNVTATKSFEFESSSVSETEGGTGVAGTDYEIDGTQVTILKKGDYVFSGICADGSIKVKKGTDNVNLYFNGLNLTSKGEDIIAIKKSEESERKVNIVAVTGTTNTLSDTAETDKNATVIDAGDLVDLTISGGGSLAINANEDKGIKANDKLTIDGNVTLNVTAADNGIAAENILTINGGDITVKSTGGDAIRSKPDELSDTTQGNIIINGGTFDLTATAGDGICTKKDDDDTNTTGDSQLNTTINGGTFKITAKCDGIQSDNNLTVSNADITVKANDGNTTKLAEDADSCKGLKASSTLTLNSGTYNIDSADDAIHSNDAVNLYAGTYTLKTGDDAVHSDATLTVGKENASNSDLKINIENCNEGLEGKDVYINSGDIDVISTGNGINASGDGSTQGGEGQAQQQSEGGEGQQQGQGSGTQPTPPSKPDEGGEGSGTQPTPPDQPGGDQGKTATCGIYIKGGDIYVNANGDGLDSNGNIEITGGKVIVFGSSGGGDAAVDWSEETRGTCVVKGGEVLAVGNSNMAKNFSDGSQNFVVSKTSVTNGKYISVKDSTGLYLISEKAQKGANHIIYSSPKMTSSDGYTIEITDTQKHTLEKTAKVEATCVNDGLNEYYYCTTCGKYFSDINATQEITDLESWKAGSGKISATGHQWDNGVVTKKATAKSKGQKKYTCKVCQAVKYEATKKLTATNKQLKINTTKKTVSYSALKKSSQSFKIKTKVKGNRKLTYKKVSGSKGVTLNAKKGVVTLKKGLKKGNYKLKVRVQAKKTKKYKKVSTVKTIKITVK